MSVQVAGLASGINWQNIVNELIAADSTGINQVKTQQTTVNSQVTALGTLSTDGTALESAIFDLESANFSGAVSAQSSTSGSTWSVSADTGTAIGSYAVNMQHLATASVLSGGQNISQSLAPTSDVTGVTLANAAVATPITAGTFTVNGKQITIDTSESLQDVFTAISAATAGTVTGSYDSGSDKVSLSSSTGSLVMGAANDTSNFLQVMQLTNGSVSVASGTASVSSTNPLGALTLGSTIASSGIATALSGQDSSGNGAMVINGVTINYNTQSDTLQTLIGRINNSGAGVTANYDSTDDRMVLTNTSTGDLGITVSDAASSGNLAAALGLTSGTQLVRGDNALFSVNNGPTQTSQSNSLTAAQLGIPGLSVAADTTGTQTITVSLDPSPMTTKIQALIDAFNQFQTDVSKDTVISTDASTGAVTTSILSAIHEVGDWGSSLQMTAFSAGSALTGAVKSLDSIGIDFSGTTGQLQISDSAKLQQALSQNPSGVAAFFQTAGTGFGAIVNTAVQSVVGQISNESANLTDQSNTLGDQITRMQTQLNNEQTNLEAEFTAMETALSKIQTEQSSLSAILSSSGSSSSTSSTSSSSNIANGNIYVNGTQNSSTSSSSTSSGSSSSSS